MLTNRLPVFVLLMLFVYLNKIVQTTVAAKERCFKNVRMINYLNNSNQNNGEDLVLQTNLAWECALELGGLIQHN